MSAGWRRALLILGVLAASAVVSHLKGWVRVPGLPRLLAPISAPVGLPVAGKDVPPLPARLVSAAPGRYGYTATLLPDGEVLIVGGNTQDMRAPSIEIFNPETGINDVPGRLPVEVAGAAFTRLADSRILIAGGRSLATVSRATLYDPATGRFTATGNLVQGRADATATLLADGRVLIAGGTAPVPAADANHADASPDHNARSEEAQPEDATPEDTQTEVANSAPAAPRPLASVEIYDPATGRFSAVSDLVIGRSGHTATLLNDGHVLISGGQDAGQQVLDSAEVFDPASGKFSAAGKMTAGHGWHSATLLKSGEVLIAGGIGKDHAATDSAELYDPAANSFRATGEMQVAHSGNSATLLADGRVLIAGGADEFGNAINTAELYDPAKGTFQRTDSMNQARSGHAATLLPDGRVLVAGGYFGLCEIYDPRTAKFTDAPALHNSRYGRSAMLLRDGRVLFMGGSTDSDAAGMEIYDPARPPDPPNKLPERRDEFPVDTMGHTATLLKDGRVLIAGGVTTGRGFGRPNALVFDPKTRQLSATGRMHVGRANASATLLNDGRVLIAGGLGDPDSALTLDSAEIYDPATGAFSETGHLMAPRAFHNATLLDDGRVLITGGGAVDTPLRFDYTGPKITGGPLTTAEIYDPKTGQFSLTGAPEQTRNFSSATLLKDGQVLVTGGNTPQTQTLADLYDPDSGQFVRTGGMAFPGVAHVAVLLPDGRVLLAGTFDHPDGTRAYVSQVYDPARGGFIAGGRVNGVGRITDMVLLKAGGVLIIGSDGAAIAALPAAFSPR